MMGSDQESINSSLSSSSSSSSSFSSSVTSYKMIKANLGQIKREYSYEAIAISKKKGRAQAANYLIEGKDKYILRYPKEDLVKILKDSEYHSKEWKKMDPEEDEEIIEEAITKKSTSIYIYEKW
ncbi:hypothetical protein RclHR1_03770007 [Rhizophagus clarus]|uniref:Uncharacterized protein n=1 Tax=Rhizophagus clarus TaxID=94130 RepID=A0A2Z6RT28_9GLOM|nr:hypothetical protein RclHR1_03770007 [Rhizophagus clarus]